MSDGHSRDSGRLDKWLWHARFFRTRSLAARAVAGGVRINGQRVTRPAASIRPGDVLTFAQAGTVRVIEIVALAERRDAAPLAAALYRDCAATEAHTRAAPVARPLEAPSAPSYKPSR